MLAKQLAIEIQTQSSSQSTVKGWRVFTQGFLCNLLNPKAILFILAFFTLIVKPSTSWTTQMGYGVEIALIHFVWFSSLAMMITHHRVKEHLNKVQQYVIKIMGIVLIGFGARIVNALMQPVPS